MRAYMKWVDSYLRMVINDNILCRVLLWDHAFMYDEVVGIVLNYIYWNVSEFLFLMFCNTLCSLNQQCRSCVVVPIEIEFYLI
jgi:hypothetical protein